MFGTACNSTRQSRRPALLIAAVLAAAVTFLVPPTDAHAATTINVSQGATLVPSDGFVGQQFGRLVATSGDTVVVGAAGDNHYTGAAYVFVRSGSAWIQQAKLTASDGVAGDSFGQAAAISGDTVLVGAVPGQEDGIAKVGSAYVFVRSGSAWAPQAKLSGNAPGDNFGSAVALSGDTALVGAPDPFGLGSAHVFTRSGSVWAEQDQFFGGSFGGFFGARVALSGDTALIGEPKGTGAVYAVTRSGSTWSQPSKLVTPSDVVANEGFGQALALSGDTALISAPYGDFHHAGSVYVFTRSGSAWAQQTKLIAPESTSSYFGEAVALVDDTALVGVPRNGVGSGEAYLFSGSGSAWDLQAKITHPGGARNEQFGYSVALTADRAMIGMEPDFDLGSAVIEFGLDRPTPPTPGPGATPPTPGPGATPPTPPAASRSGYWMAGSDGAVYAFGDALRYGNATSAVHLEPTPSGNGYWTVDAAGVVSAFGDARHLGNADRSKLAAAETITSLSATPSGNGYWIFTTKGRVLPLGDATGYGDMSATHLNGPVVGSIPTPTGKGYYMVASDGGIFSFGDARFHGSMGAKKLNAAVQSLVPTADGAGYWLVASDGGIFAFNAPFRGSMGDKKLNKPVTGMVRFGNGYLMVGQDGGIFNFSDRPFYGSLGANPPKNPITSVAVLEK